MPLPRSRRGDCSPITQRMASTTFDFPQPLGPTTAVIPSLKSIRVLSTNDLKPFSSSDLIRNGPPDDRGRTAAPSGRMWQRLEEGVGSVYHPEGRIANTKSSGPGRFPRQEPTAAAGSFGWASYWR